MSPTRALPCALLCLPLLAALLAAPARAGDPCPIDFTFHDLGAPSWLDRAALLDGLASKDSWVGVSFSTRSEGGVRIDAVSAGSPAAKAGLATGQIVTAVGEAPVKTHQALAAIFRATKPGSQLTLRRADGTEARLTLGRQDPVLGALIDHAAKQACSFVRRGDVDPAKVEALRAKVFHDNRRFRCDDAHTRLTSVLEPGDIVLVRGSKRLLLANPGWATVCVRASDVDGAKLAPGVPGLFEALSKAYVADRHANP